MLLLEKKKTKKKQRSEWKGKSPSILEIAHFSIEKILKKPQVLQLIKILYRIQNKYLKNQSHFYTVATNVLKMRLSKHFHLH